MTQSSNSDEIRFLGRWQLGECIADSRWFWIYRCRPDCPTRGTSFDYLIKAVRSDLELSTARLAVDRFSRQVVSADAVAHRSVLPLLDAELDRPPFFAVYPMIAGRTLEPLLNRPRRWSLTRVLWVLRQLAEALEATAAGGRVHLAIRPDHVIVEYPGRVTLLGWGNSHAIDQRVWIPADDLCAVHYTAPESLHNGYRAHPASDVYSLGALAFRMIAGRPPFEGNDLSEVMLGHLNQRPDDLRGVEPLVSRELQMLVQMMLAKTPLRRPTAREVVERLVTLEIKYLGDHSAATSNS